MMNGLGTSGRISTPNRSRERSLRRLHPGIEEPVVLVLSDFGWVSMKMVF